MCDPTTLAVVSLAGSAVSAGAGIYEGQQAAAGIAATQKAQNDANDAWVAYQTRIHNQQAADEDAARTKATEAQQDTLGKIGPAAQEQAQTTEQQRLNALFNAAGAGTAQGADPRGMLLSGESTGNQSFMDSLTKEVSQASSAARQRIAALASASSYGGSYGGLGTTVPIAFAAGGNDINLQNAIRQGGLKTYGVEQQVQPVNYQVGPGTTAQASLGKALGQLAGTLAGSAGPKLIGQMGTPAVGNAAGLDPAFSSAALTSFNDPSVNWNPTVSV